jgi:hypothetical protein
MIRIVTITNNFSFVSIRLFVVRKARYIRYFIPTLSNNGGPQIRGGSSTQSSTNWEDLCNNYRSLVSIHTPCSDLAHGTQLTQQCKTGLKTVVGCIRDGLGYLIRHSLHSLFHVLLYLLYLYSHSSRRR